MIHTDAIKTWLANVPTTITLGDDQIVVADLPAEIGHAVAVLNEWQASLRWHELEAIKLRRAIEHLSGDLAGKLTEMQAGKPTEPATG